MFYWEIPILCRSAKTPDPGGLCVKLFGRLLSKLVGVDIVLPPLLGMLMVGVLLKNIPYNFGQFGRAECTIDGQNATFVDSLHDLENPDHGFKRSIPDSVLLQVCKRSIEHRILSSQCC